MTEKEKFLRKFNEAFAKNDIDFIVESVTENIKWTMVGDKTVQGKEEFEAYLKNMQGPEMLEMKVSKIITHGKSAAVDGSMKIKTPSGEEKNFGFCDVCEFSGFKNPKIREIRSYVVEITEK